jgi:hypothetical protein
MIFVFSNAQESYDDTEIHDFLNDNKNKSFIQKNAYSFMSIPNEKNYRERLAGEIIIKDTSIINIGEMNVNFLMHDYQYYYVKNFNILFVLKSVDHLKNEMNNEN